jgi:hypothetical protein
LQKIAQALRKKILLVPVPVSWVHFVAGLCGKQDVTNRLFSSFILANTRGYAGHKEVPGFDLNKIAII